MLKKVILTAASFTLGLSAYAGTATQNLNVNAAVANTCYIESSSIANVDFGSIDGLFLSDSSANGGFAVQCTNGADYSIQFNGGQNLGSGSVPQLSDGNGQLIQYNLFVDSAYSNPWTTAQSEVGNGAVQSYTVYGLIPSGQGVVTAAAFSDVQQITVSF